MKRQTRIDAFTLVEVMIVVAIIGLLASMAIPAFQKARIKAQAARVASDLRVFSHAFAQFAMFTGAYPDDTNLILPPGMGEYIKTERWEAPVFGGRYNWEGPDYYGFAGISLTDSTAPESAMLVLDKMIDNGNLGSGMFRRIGGRFTYIVEE